MNNVLHYFRNFILLVLFQGLILNNIELGGFINPYLYILFIISLPFETPRWLVLIFGFILGISIDSFASTLGMHTAATVFLAFCRAYLLKLIEPRDGYGFNGKPTIQLMGLTWYLVYVSALVFLHHIFLFYVESFKIASFFLVLGRVFMSSLFTIILVLIVQLFNYKTSNKV